MNSKTILCSTDIPVCDLLCSDRNVCATGVCFIHEYRIHLITSGRVGRFPYMRMPMRKMRPASQIIPRWKEAQNDTEHYLKKGRSLHGYRYIIRIGLKRGISERTTASGPSDSCRWRTSEKADHDRRQRPPLQVLHLRFRIAHASMAAYTEEYMK